MLVAVSLRYPVVFAYICIDIDFTIFFSKNKWQNSLIPENMRVDILFMSLAYVVAKLLAKMFIFFYTLAAILDFAILDLILDL